MPPNYDPNSDDYHYPPRHEPDAELDRLRVELRDWQTSSEAYRHDAERAEARVVELEALCRAQHGAVARAERAEAKVAAGLSWGGFNLFGDSKSIDEAKRLVHEAGRLEQLVVLIKDERARAERAEARVVELEAAGNRIGDTAINSILDGMEIHQVTLARAEAERVALREALADLVNFAWTAVTADCEEARVNLNGKIAKARAALDP